MKIKYSIFLLLILVLGCGEKKYIRTVRIPKCDLYVEVFTANSFGLKQEYLTDSSNFRIYVGTLDEEHDFFTYECRNDTLYIKKILTGDKNCRWVIIDGRQRVRCDTEFIVRDPISMRQLKIDKKFE
jgi:hypothetical protein